MSPDDFDVLEDSICEKASELAGVKIKDLSPLTVEGFLIKVENNSAIIYTSTYKEAGLTIDEYLDFVNFIKVTGNNER